MLIENNILIYELKDGSVIVDVNVQNDDVWLSQELIAKLYDTTKQNISYHLGNIFKDGELVKDSVVKEFLTTASDEKNYNVDIMIMGIIFSLRGRHYVN